MLFSLIFLVLIVTVLGLLFIHDKEIKRNTRTFVYLLICGIFTLIIFFLGMEKGKPITELEDEKIYIVHFQYTDWESSSGETPVFLGLATKTGGNYLHYEIPRYKLLNEGGEFFDADNWIYPAFRVDEVKTLKIISDEFNQEAEKFTAYRLIPVAGFFPLKK